MLSDELDVYGLLEAKGFQYDNWFDGYSRIINGNHEFISSNAVRLFPGDVSYYLRTGFVRNVRIFDCGYFQPSPRSLGFRSHKDGRCVKIRKIK